MWKVFPSYVPFRGCRHLVGSVRTSISLALNRIHGAYPINGSTVEGSRSSLLPRLMRNYRCKHRPDPTARKPSYLSICIVATMGKGACRICSVLGLSTMHGMSTHHDFASSGPARRHGMQGIRPSFWTHFMRSRRHLQRIRSGPLKARNGYIPFASHRRPLWS